MYVFIEISKVFFEKHGYPELLQKLKNITVKNKSGGESAFHVEGNLSENEMLLLLEFVKKTPDIDVLVWMDERLKGVFEPYRGIDNIVFFYIF